MMQKDPEDEIRPTLREEGRWALLGELKQAQGLKGEWSPVTLRVEELVPDERWVFNGGEKVVTLTFDSRVPYRTLVSALAEIWPELTDRGWVSRTRDLNDLSLSLVRHVCLDHAHSGWQERLDRWNEKFPDGHKWHFTHRRALISRFHRAEESLTGTRDGLRNLYATAGNDLRKSLLVGPGAMLDALTRRTEAGELGEAKGD